MTKDEEKSKVFNSFFISDFNSKTSCSLSAQTLQLEDRDRERNEDPEEMVSDLLHHLDSHKSMQPDGSTQGF